MGTNRSGIDAEHTSRQGVECISQVQLPDESVISLRELNPGDTDDVVRLYETLTDDERYLRFFTMHPAHLRDRARSITQRSNGQYALGHSTPRSLWA